jgi:hypothetical protein
MEPQLAHLPAQMLGVGLVQRLGLLSQQTDEKVDPTEITITQTVQPLAHLRFDLDVEQRPHAPNAICIRCYIGVGLAAGAADQARRAAIPGHRRPSSAVGMVVGMKSR